MGPAWYDRYLVGTGAFNDPEASRTMFLGDCLFCQVV